MAADQKTDGRLSSTKLRLIAAAVAALLLAALVPLREGGVLCRWLVPDPGYLEVTTVGKTKEHLSLRLSLLESKTSVHLEKISVPRALQRALEVQPPPGFAVEGPPPPPKPTAARAVVDAYDSYNEKVHFVGRLIVRADAPVDLQLPVRPQQGARGTVEFMYRGTSAVARLCDGRQFVNVEIGVAVEQGVAPDEAR
jgi:hypothetical protein